MAADDRRPERIALDRAWTGYASGDFQGARQAFPSHLTELGNSRWSFAAEAALICSLIEYCCGEMSNALVHARMAQNGLSDKGRELFLLPTLVVQSSIAYHHRHREQAEAIWQIAAHLPVASDEERSWVAAISSVALASKGLFEEAKEQSLRAIELSADQPPHRCAHIAWLVRAQILRDQGDGQAAQEVLNDAFRRLDDFPNLPMHGELRALQAHLDLDEQRRYAESIESVAALSSHPFATEELQDHLDYIETPLRIRTNEMTRAKVLAGRIEPSPRRTILECAINAESRPSKTLGILASGAFKWHRHQIETEIIRSRARRKDLNEAAMQIWRAIERALTSNSIRPFLDYPLVVLALTNPEFVEHLGATRPGGDHGDELESHLERVLQAQAPLALQGPETHALSARELEILRAVKSGGDFNTVAKMLVVSRWTVRGHFYSACRKLGVSGMEAAMAKLREIDA